MNKGRIITILLWLAPILNIIACVIYNWKIVHGAVSPNAVAWGIWGVITLLNFTSYKSMTGDWIKSVFPTVSSMLCITTFILSACFGHFAHVETSDFGFLALGILAALVWWWKQSAFYAQVVLQIALFLGFVPIIISLLAHPGTENVWCWAIWTISFIFQTALVLMRWEGRYMDLVYPLWSGFTCHASVTALIIWRS